MDGDCGECMSDGLELLLQEVGWEHSQVLPLLVGDWDGSFGVFPVDWEQGVVQGPQ